MARRPSVFATFSDEILDDVRAGASINAACSGRGIKPNSFQVWLTHNPAQRARFTAAIADRRPITEFDDEILDLITQGMTIAEAVATNPKFPSYQSWRCRASKDRALAAKLKEARARFGAMPSPAFKQVVDRIDEFCALIAAGSAIDEAITALGLPCKSTIFSVFRRRSDLREKYVAASRSRQRSAKARRIGALYSQNELRAAAAARTIYRGSGPSLSTVKAHCARDPDLRRVYQSKKASASHRQRLQDCELHRAAIALVPKTLSSFDRDDIAQDLIVELLMNQTIDAKKTAASHFAKSVSRERSLDELVFRYRNSRGGREATLHEIAQSNAESILW